MRVTNINWELLRQQKEWLLSHQDASEAIGLLNLLDYIQDSAIEDGAEPSEVFGNSIGA